MKSFEVTKRISAPAETIWSLLVDVARWTEWNPTIARGEGRAEPGGKVTIYPTINPKRGFKLKVTEFVPHSKMVWGGGMPLGLFRGERTYTLTPQGNGQVEFRMREEFTGLMAPLITKSIPDLQPSFEEFAEALKKRAEGGGRNG